MEFRSWRAGKIIPVEADAENIRRRRQSESRGARRLNRGYDPNNVPGWATQTQAVDVNANGITMSAGPGSTSLTLRCPSGRTFHVPARLLTASINQYGALVLSLPGNVAQQILAEVQAEQERSRARRYG